MYTIENLKNIVKYRMAPEDQEPCMDLMEKYPYLFKFAKGSRKSHQAWEGGYIDHVCDCMNFAYRLYRELKYTPPFPLTDALLVLFWHDIEKICMYSYVPPLPLTKADRKVFRAKMLQMYNVRTSPEIENAFKYVEGENEDYEAGERTMGPLAAFCHMCDLYSARIFPNER